MKSFPIARVRDFGRTDDRSSFWVVGLENHLLHELGGRGQWVAIEGKETVFRQGRGTGSNIPLQKEEIELDYDSRLKLGAMGNYQEPWNLVQLTVRRTSKFERLLVVHWKNPDPAYRVPFQLGMFGLLTGMAGLIVGVAGFVISLL